MNALKMVAAAISLIAALPAAAVTINFDQLPNGSTLPSSGTTISTQYASQGVTFLGTNTANGTSGALNAWGLIAATGPGGSGNYLGNFGAIPASQVPGPSDYLIAPRYNVMTMQFINVASAISFGLYTGGGQNSVTINAYDAAGGLLRSLGGVMANEGRYDIQTLAASGVARLDILSLFNTNGTVRLFGIDNLTFTAAPVQAAVPESATWMMMIMGFGMTGSVMRRRSLRIAFTAN